MKQVYALLFPLFVLSGSSFAQYLAENTKAVPSLLSGNVTASASGPASAAAPSPESQQWQKEQDLVSGHISSGKLAKMKDMTEAIVAYFHDSCITEGQYSPVWHGEYFSDKASSGRQMKFRVQCDFDDQKASLTILANDIRPLLDHLVVNSQDILTIRPVADEKKNCPYFEYAVNGDETGNTGSDGRGLLRSRVWLVTTGSDQLPYIPVSRAAYLQEARKELTATKNAIIADMKQNMPVRTAAVQEADKKSALEQLSAIYSGMDLQVRTKMFLTAYRTDEQYQKENIDKGTTDLDKTLHLMDSLLDHSTTESLDKPAIVSVQAVDFRGFEDGYGDKMLIRLNPAFFTADNKGKAPQCLLVRWQYDPSAPMAGEIDRQLQERFDAQKMKDSGVEL